MEVLARLVLLTEIHLECTVHGEPERERAGLCLRKLQTVLEPPPRRAIEKGADLGRREGLAQFGRPYSRDTLDPHHCTRDGFDEL